MQSVCPYIPSLAVKQSANSCSMFVWEWLVALLTAMAYYAAENVARLFKDGETALDNVCTEASDDDPGMEDIKVAENPYYNHAPEFDNLYCRRYNYYFKQNILEGSYFKHYYDCSYKLLCSYNMHVFVIAVVKKFFLL